MFALNGVPVCHVMCYYLHVSQYERHSANALAFTFFWHNIFDTKDQV